MSATSLPLPGGLTRPISRRALLRAGGTLAGALAVGAGGAMLTTGPERLVGLRRSDYVPWIGSTFHLRAAGRPRVPVRLAAVENPSARRTPTDPEAEFLLVFRLTASDAPFGQAFAELRHPAGYRRSLLVSPISGRGLDLGIIVNRSTH